MVIIFRPFSHCGAMLEVGKFSLLFFASNLLLVTSDHAGEWSQWSTCSVSCGEGIRVRNRTCDFICNTTLQTQGCSNAPCHDQDIETQIIMVVLVTITVVSIITAVLVVIFFIKGTEHRKQRSSSIDTSKRLRTTIEKAPGNLGEGISVQNRVFLLQRLAESKSSFQTSRTTLKDFGESKL